MTNIRVSSGEFLKAYGRISETALREPVSITNHGRERLVLLSADEYRRLKRNDRVALSIWDSRSALRSQDPFPAFVAHRHILPTELKRIWYRASRRRTAARPAR